MKVKKIEITDEYTIEKSIKPEIINSKENNMKAT